MNATTHKRVCVICGNGGRYPGRLSYGRVEKVLIDGKKQWAHLPCASESHSAGNGGEKSEARR